ncbi:MAG TPA: (4Fe-4S)-binding protein [Deltaproteobacteria bacterium]|nr:(4Fe-4S)-binding protein [Deltaproteobacteria bacterium]
MIVAVASGKGGTGKTTVATNLAAVLEEAQLVDCDAEEPNAHLFLNPEIETSHTVTLHVPQVDEAKCTHCRKCAEACEYHALMVLPQQVLVFEELCHGCGACSFVCPEGAISERPKEIGRVEVGRRGKLRFIRGILNLGEPMASPVIKGAKAAMEPGLPTILDAPPGTSCPVVETVKGADFCCLVTEPTPFGLHDLRLAVGMVRKLGIKMGVVINRADVGKGVKEFCLKEGIPVLGEIPFREVISRVCSRGGLIVEEIPGYKDFFSELWKKIETLAEG